MTDQLGFDISHFQTISDHDLESAVRSGRYEFGGLKASEGTYQIDPTFWGRRQVMRHAAFPRRVYHEATTQSVGLQLEQIMQATGGFLYPRERLMIVLGDFSVPPMLAIELLRAVEKHGPTKREPLRRPLPIAYANRSLWKTVYNGSQFDPFPKEVAAYPGDGSEFTAAKNVVFHQFSNHDPVTGGDLVRANPAFSSQDLRSFFLR